jgi:hypothetical protein
LPAGACTSRAFAQPDTRSCHESQPEQSSGGSKNQSRPSPQAQVDAGGIPGAPHELANLQNQIAVGDLKIAEPIEIQLTDSEKTRHSNEWRAYQERNASLAKCRGQMHSLILGQCSQLLKDKKLKQDTNWTTVLVSRLIEKTVLAQTEDQHPFARVHDQEMSFCLFCQSETMSNPQQWYERFDGKADIGVAIGVTRQHKALIERVAQEQTTGTVVVTFDGLTVAEQDLVRKDAEEQHILCACLRQSGPQHGKLKVDLQNDFTTGNNCCPKTRQQTLHLLD